jgi:hypothetical protein
MKYAIIIGRPLLGLVFVFFGSNAFPALHPDAANARPGWRVHAIFQP